MKKSVLLMYSAIVATMVSCTVDTTPKGVAPASNEITLDTDLSDLRIGETITATMVIPTGGQNIMSEERGWKLDGDVLFVAPYTPTAFFPNIISVKEEGGKSIFVFYCEDPGEHSIVYYTRYNWKGLTDGSSYKDVEVTKTITAIEGDIYGSKWGDSIARTKKVHDGIEQSSSNENVYIGSLTDPFGSLNILRSFTFSNDKLEKIEEYLYTDKSTETLYNIFLRWHKKIQEKQGFTYDSAKSTRNNIAGAVKIVDTSSDEAKAENAALISGELQSVHTVYSKTGTDAAIDLWVTEENGSKVFNFSRTYNTPAN